jgi:hypothetical protein
MANTFKFGNGNWAVKDGYALAYNDENNNFKPLPFDFTRASSATRVNKQGLIETVPSGKPRIDFTDNTDGHLLLEPSRSNYVTYSEDLTGGSKNVVTATANTTETLDPSGNNNATKFQVTASGADAYSRTQYTAALTNFSCFIYVKAAAGQKFQIFAARDGYAQIVNGDLITCTGDWQKVEFSGTFDTTSSTVVFGIEFGHSATDSVSGQVYYCWGAQLEQGSYATSYIPTEGSSVTRVAEVANGAGNSTVFNDSEGVLYVEISALANDGTSRRISISAGNSNNDNLVSLIYGTSNKISPSIYSNGNFQMGGDYTLSDQTQKIKVALKYSLNDAALWVNGVEVLTDDIVTTPIGLNQIKFEYGNGSNDFYGKVKNLKVYNTALTDTELQNLTS